MNAGTIFGVIFMIGCSIFVVYYLCKIDSESKPENLKETKEDLIYKKINTIFTDLSKDIFLKKLYDIKYDYKNRKYKWYEDAKKLDKSTCDINYTLALYQLNIFCLNYKFYKNIFDVFNSKYYFYSNNNIYLDIIEDFNNICKLDDMVGELPRSNSLSYKNFLINSFLKKYGQKLVRNGNESYYVNTYILKQEYCLSIEDQKKYIKDKENLSNE